MEVIEAPLLGIPSINLGNRQEGRIKSSLTKDCTLNSKEIITQVKNFKI